MSDGLQEQLEMNQQTWSLLQREAGVREGDSLPVDGFFDCPDQPAAQAVADELTGAGWRCQVEKVKTGLFKKAVWSVQATKVMQLSLNALDEMVVEFDAVAERHGCGFDGWGAAYGGS